MTRGRTLDFIWRESIGIDEAVQLPLNFSISDVTMLECLEGFAEIRVGEEFLERFIKSCL